MTGRRKPKSLETAALAGAMHAEVADRSDGRCEFERLYRGIIGGSTHVATIPGPRLERIVEWDAGIVDPERSAARSSFNAWARCGAPVRDLGAGCAHIFRRWKCGATETDDGIPLKWHPLVVLAGCADCHPKFDSRQYDDRVRPPAEAAAKAKALIEHTLAAARERGEAGVDVDLSHF